MVRGLLIAASLVACGSRAPRLERVDLGAAHRGLSGLARDGSGQLWAVSERGQNLVRFAADGSGQVIVPIRGLPDGDLESLAWLDGQRFAAGTESREAGAIEAILILEVAGGVATIADRIAVESGVAGPGNQGIEGLCAAGGVALAAFETPIEVAGGRAARLVRVELDSRRQRRLSLRLTSATGKISGLDCRRRGDRLEVLAIERHFEVVRVLRFTVPDGDSPGPIQPSIAADIGAIRRDSDNPEGVIFDGDDAALLVLDNDYGEVTGPSELIRIRLR